MLLQFQVTRKINTLVIGAGPTGLATSYLLKERDIEHVLLEQSDQVASSWRSLWDNYKLAMRAENIAMPGVDIAKRFDKHEHPGRDQMIALFEWYANQHQLPIQFNSKVLSVLKNAENQFVVKTEKVTCLCDNVVCCIGPRHHPKYPMNIALLKSLNTPTILHSSEYRTAAHFPMGSKVLVVGSGASALSIAYDVLKQGYQVELGCAHTQAEIYQANKHLYDAADIEVVPTLDFLLAKGLVNHGRLQQFEGAVLRFQKEDIEEQVSSLHYGAIIFATGFERSFKLLQDMLGHLKPSMNNGQSETPGLYIAGIPRENEQTVIISDGSQHAADIVTAIVKSMPTVQTVAKPSEMVAKYNL